MTLSKWTYAFCMKILISLLDKLSGVTVNSKDQISLPMGALFKDNGISESTFLNRLDRDTAGCIVIAKSGLAPSLSTANG